MNYILHLGVKLDNSCCAAVGYLYADKAADMPYTGIVEETTYAAVGPVGKSVIRNIVERATKHLDMKTLYIVTQKQYMKTVSDLVWEIRMSMTTEVICAEYAGASSMRECRKATELAIIKLREGAEKCLYSQ